MEEEIFWLDGFKGNAKSGYYVRNPLFEFIEKCEKQGFKIVGIKKPTDWNMEIIIEQKEVE